MLLCVYFFQINQIISDTTIKYCFIQSEKGSAIYYFIIYFGNVTEKYQNIKNFIKES